MPMAQIGHDASTQARARYRAFMHYDIIYTDTTSIAIKPQMAATPILVARVRFAAPVPPAVLVVEVVDNRVVPVLVLRATPEVGVALEPVAALVPVAVIVAVPEVPGTVHLMQKTHRQV